MLKLITLTGFDDNNKIEELYEIQSENVEFGILISSDKDGVNRFPSVDWIKKFSKHNFNFSIHVCGKTYIDNICKNQFSKLFNEEKFNVLVEKCSRIQFNFFNQIENFSFKDTFSQFKDKKIIVQLNNSKFIEEELFKNENILPFFDCSGGKGILPIDWPSSSIYCGYAGGLNSVNLENNLKIINKKCFDYWIDVETGIRTDNIININKCKEFLTIANQNRD